jgi:hypothetical protein
MYRRFTTFSLFALFTLVGVLPAQKATPRIASGPEASSAARTALRGFLQRYLRDPDGREDKSTEYVSRFVDLTDDGKREVIVYLTGRDWCGSGGCTAFVLAPEGPSYKVITEFSITRPPIRVLATTSSGWHDLAVQVQGGGIMKGYEARLAFDGKTYPRNPSVSPAQKILGSVKGDVVIASSSKGELLYP